MADTAKRDLDLDLVTSLASPY